MLTIERKDTATFFVTNTSWLDYCNALSKVLPLKNIQNPPCVLPPADEYELIVAFYTFAPYIIVFRIFHCTVQDAGLDF